MVRARRNGADVLLKTKTEADAANEIQVRLRELIKLAKEQGYLTFDDLNDAKNLREDLGLDSVDVVSIVSQVERHYRIRLDQRELENLVTVGDLLTLLQAKLEAPPTSAVA